MSNITPASSTTGFFQPKPRVLNQFVEDRALRRMARLFLSAKGFEAQHCPLTAFADAVLAPEVFRNIVEAERHPPYLNGDGYTAFGSPQDANALVTSHGWKYLQDFGLHEGVVAIGYDETLGPAARIVQALRVHLWAPSSAMVVCPSGMQDGAVSVLRKELAENQSPGDLPAELRDARTRVFKSALSHLLDRDPKNAWTSGQWMTERKGGSDVRGTETVARWVGSASTDLGTDVDGLPLGLWSITGFKFFSSATDCGCSLVLAYTDKGLSCFFAPTRRLLPDGTVVMNGIRIQRLKNKLGTHALPTAELEISDMRAWLVGEEGKGVNVISTVLNVSRFHNAARAVGFYGRGLSIARAFARVRAFPSRTAPNNYLRSIPLFLRTLASNTVQYRADVFLVGFLSALLGADNTGVRSTPLVPADARDVSLMLRVLTSLSKAYTTKHTIAGLQECMEALGGIGYLENEETPEVNVARLFRDANVFAIWEGTTDILSTDTVKVLRGKDGEAVISAIDTWLRTTIGEWAFIGDDITGAAGLPARLIVHAWNAFKELPADKEELVFYARNVVKLLGDIIAATLLVTDAEHDEDPVAAECARRFTNINFAVYAPPPSKPPRIPTWQEVSAWDEKIAFETDPAPGDKAKL